MINRCQENEHSRRRGARACRRTFAVGEDHAVGATRRYRHRQLLVGDQRLPLLAAADDTATQHLLVPSLY